MRILLDTNIALWAVVGSRRLAPAAKQAILAADEVWVSVASLWEIAIKHYLGRGDMPISSAMALQAFQDAGYGLLVVRPGHVLRWSGSARFTTTLSTECWSPKRLPNRSR